MPLPPGSRIGHYDIAAAIGAGGMGEVYRARDTRLDRDVALKILPESFAADPDRLMRFTREARTLASSPSDLPQRLIRAVTSWKEPRNTDYQRGLTMSWWK